MLKRLVAYPGFLVVAMALFWMVSIRMPGRSFAGSPPPLTAAERETARRLQRDVAYLADSIGEREARSAHAGLERAAQWLNAELTAIAGHAPRSQPYRVGTRTVRNLEMTVPSAGRGAFVVVGAHYDAVPVTPGADDNASGVAALLELARRLHERPADCAVRLVFFTNEEPPFFYSDSMGSLVYARALAERRERPLAMLSLESIGYFRDAPRSQRYPPVLGWFYPGTADFIAFVGNVRSRGLVHRAIADFREVATIPSAGAAAPAFFPGVGWSDHWSFWQVDVPAVMVTGTAPFRNPHYHEASDRTDGLDLDRMARVVTGVEHVVRRACGARGA